jgi:hypothetical protein
MHLLFLFKINGLSLLHLKSSLSLSGCLSVCLSLSLSLSLCLSLSFSLYLTGEEGVRTLASI